MSLDKDIEQDPVAVSLSDLSPRGFQRKIGLKILTIRLTDAGWLKRTFSIESDQGALTIEYNGRGIGYESVLVNGISAIRKTSWLWFVPRFELTVGGHEIVVEVRAWPWLTIRMFRLSIDNQLAYGEG